MPIPNFPVLLALCTAACSFSAYGQASDSELTVKKIKKRIIGTWYITTTTEIDGRQKVESDEKRWIKFHKNGKCEGGDHGETKREGQWSVSPDKTITLSRNKGGRTETVTVISISKTKLVIQQASGESATFVKAKE